MSELTKCNYCDLKSIRRRARARGEKIVVVGQTAYRIPKSMSKRDFMKLPTGSVDARTGKGKYFVAWFMAIPDHCCC
jgi:hypothetical protein